MRNKIAPVRAVLVLALALAGGLLTRGVGPGALPARDRPGTALAQGIKSGTLLTHGLAGTLLTQGLGPGPGELRAGALLNKTVQDSGGQTLGRIADFVINQDTGKVDFIIVEADPSVISGDRRMVAVPWVAFQPGAAGALALRVTKDKFRGAPAFAPGEMPDLAAQDYRNELYIYYGIQPELTEPQEEQNPFFPPEMQTVPSEPRTPAM